jgi:hypothetical protein
MSEINEEFTICAQCENCHLSLRSNGSGYGAASPNTHKAHSVEDIENARDSGRQKILCAAEAVRLKPSVDIFTGRKGYSLSDGSFSRYSMPAVDSVNTGKCPHFKPTQRPYSEATF